MNAIPSSESDIADRVTKAISTKADKIVYLKGDKEAEYGRIMKMMDALRASQIESVALITERPGGNKGGGQ